MTRQQIVYRAALSRIALGVAALALLPQLYPDTARHAWVFVAYIGCAVVEQFLIRHAVGGVVRPLVFGLLDAALISFVAHALGSTVTVFASLYFLTGMLNALVVGLRVGVAITCMSVAGYASVVWAEHFGVLAFAPDLPSVARLGPPSFSAALAASGFLTVFLFMCTIIVAMLVMQLRKHEEELLVANRALEELSHRDALTSLYNRRFVFSAMEREIARAARGHPLAILMLDLDGFKHVNDTQGHLRGDMLLKEIAQALSETTRKADIAARYGGDEFVVVLPDTDTSHAEAVAARVAESVRAIGCRFDGEHPVTASVGIAIAEHGDGVAALLRRADDNAYRAKQRGGDRVVA